MCARFFGTLVHMLSRDAFKREIYRHYHAEKRALPWRERADDPYAVLVSEIMLQQTQAERVAPKFEAFLKKFPTVAALADADTADILRAWQGLGYNRRALHLKRCAEEIMEKYGGSVPDDPEALEMLPGIGHYTARAICAFAFNMPHAFIETNIRSVYIHFFFQAVDRSERCVHDTEILKLVEQTMDKKHPREWFSALMDYGSDLKKKVSNPSRASTHYTRQSKFKGSNREMRGAILRLLAGSEEPVALARIRKLPFEKTRLKANLSALEKEGFITKKQSKIRLA